MSARILSVNQNHAAAQDSNPGTPEKPFKTIQAAALLAEAGDTVRVHAGVYRERISPARGGAEGRPLTFEAAKGEKVYIRGSDIFAPRWEAVAGAPGVFKGSLRAVKFGSAAYHGVCDEQLFGDFNPYLLNFNRGKVARPHTAVVERVEAALAEMVSKQEKLDPVDVAFHDLDKRKNVLVDELQQRTRENNRSYMTTLGQLFVEGRPLTEVETTEELGRTSATWMVSAEGDAILMHLPDGADLKSAVVELSVRHTLFSPLIRRLGYITVRGFVIEHAANHFPTWGKTGWSQVGALSTRTGHHWIIENNVIRLTKGLGIDCGSEGGSENKEKGGDDPADHGGFREKAKTVGYHLIRNNHICDNGHCGIAGIGHYGTQVVGNVIERNNYIGLTSPWWEFGGIKFHFFFDGLIEGNLIRDNDGHGVWIDNQWRGSRVTRNLILNNLWSGINVELGRGPVLIDHNIIAYTRQGDGIYGHDVADVTIAHNLLYANGRHGVWFAYCTPRVKPEDGCWDIHTYNNMIMGNGVAAIGYSMPWYCAGRNTSDGNLFMGSGSYLDEGSGPMEPLFSLTNKSHCGQIQNMLPAEVKAMNPETVYEMLSATLDKADFPPAGRPDATAFKKHFTVTLDVWRAVLGCDIHSATTEIIRDGLQTRNLSWDIHLKEDITKPVCQKVAGVEKDFFGNPLGDKPLPGPFQNIEAGRNHITLWPVPGVPCSVPVVETA